MREVSPAAFDFHGSVFSKFIEMITDQQSAMLLFGKRKVIPMVISSAGSVMIMPRPWRKAYASSKK